MTDTENSNGIFRKNALDRVSSPEELNRYLVVTGPGIWMTLLAVIVLLIGAFVWIIFGQLSTSVDVAVISSDGEAVCLVPAEEQESALECGVITIAGQDYGLRDAGFSPQLITSETDPNIRIAGSLAENAMVKPLAVAAELPDGIYAGKIVVEKVNLFTFIVN